MKLFKFLARQHGKAEASRQEALKANRSQNGCQRTKPGWRCTAKAGHEGPCPAVPEGSNICPGCEHGLTFHDRYGCRVCGCRGRWL